jgi:hypothetical protein
LAPGREGRRVGSASEGEVDVDSEERGRKGRGPPRRETAVEREREAFFVRFRRVVRSGEVRGSSESGEGCGVER